MAKPNGELKIERAEAKIYEGTRYQGGCVVTVNGRPLRVRLDLFNHSPDGFEWGYCGSGPAQLALAILADYLSNNDEAIRRHQRFKSAVIAGIKGAQMEAFWRSG